MNVVQLKPELSNSLPVLAEAIHTRYESAKRHDLDAQQSRVAWIEDSIALATMLGEARAQFPSDNQFGEWLETNIAFINKNDRAALIGMSVDITLMREVLTQTKSRSWDLIWRDHRSRFPSVRKPRGTNKKRAGIRPITAVGKASKLYGLPRADEVAALYINESTRTSIGKVVRSRGGRPVWDMILEGIDAGIITQNGLGISVPSEGKVNLRLLFPIVPAAKGPTFFSIASTY